MLLSMTALMIQEKPGHVRTINPHMPGFIGCMMFVLELYRYNIC